MAKLKCPACKNLFPNIIYKPGDSVRCPKCGKLLKLPGKQHNEPNQDNAEPELTSLLPAQSEEECESEGIAIENLNRPLHPSCEPPMRFVQPVHATSVWTGTLCAFIDTLAALWMVLFVWTILLFGPGTYFIFETGNAMGRLLDMPEADALFKLNALAWAFLRHAQYSAYLLVASQLLRTLERVRTTPVR